MRQALLDAGQIAGALGVLLAFVVGLSRLRPVKWTWRRLVTEPLGMFLRREIRDEVEMDFAHIRSELSFNSGGSLKDTAIRVERKVDELAGVVADIQAQQATQEAERVGRDGT